MWVVAAAVVVLGTLQMTLPGQVHAAAVAGIGDGLFSTAGYRIARYRAALPEDPPAGSRIDTEALSVMLERAEPGPVLIDVQAVTVRPESETFGISWLPTQTRYNLPGSTWLPNVGYGRLEPRMLAYLKDNLDRLTGGDPGRPLVFYCVVDCWMSWNAVKRADALGYRKLYWYAEGTDGWREAGLPLEPSTPQPLDPPAPRSRGEDGVDEVGFFPDEPVDLPTALARLRREEFLTAVLLFFETEDCLFCQRMRRELLVKPELAEYFHARFIVIAIDMESDETLIDPAGMPTSEAEFARTTMRVQRTPTLVFLGADGKELFRHIGVIIDPRVFRGLADYISEGHFERIGFREFLVGGGAEAVRP